MSSQRVWPLCTVNSFSTVTFEPSRCILQNQGDIKHNKYYVITLHVNWLPWYHWYGDFFKPESHVNVSYITNRHELHTYSLILVIS